MDVVSLNRQTLSDVWQQHMLAEFVLKDVDAALACMSDEPYVLCVASGMGGRGRAGVRDFYARQFIPQIPPDLAMTTLSRVSGSNLLVEEFVVRFTHTLAMDWLLPDVPPTGRTAEFVGVAVIGFQDGKVAREHIHWDQAAVLAQLGVLGHPVARAGITSAARLLELSDGFGVC
jgi:carboxymethylenebutenolidase